ncbi:MAG TPA: hypothetical protein VHA57_13685, partial [Actinomycetota bacterium]|nr:hypothetical protein [Actinomycetota bacterium]
VPAVLLDSPFGFQENAGDIAARAHAYFAESVGTPIVLATLRKAADADAMELAEFVAAVKAARYVFSGPGSPTYALRQWQGGPLPGLLMTKLRDGGAVTFASAAALALGVVTVPVYEIYKAGEAPHWLEGLDVLAEAGLRAAVIPHYNNTEGGNHDTRYCYLGERRLSAMEAQLPNGAFVLGVDEHTGLVLDLGEGTATVVGLGVVTVRAKGRSAELPAGTVVPIPDLPATAEALAAGCGEDETGTIIGGQVRSPSEGTGVTPHDEPSLLAGVHTEEQAFAAALSAGDTQGAVRAIIALDDQLVAWSADTLESGEADRARAAMHAMVVSLGKIAEAGARDPREVVGPFVEALLEQRARARSGGRFDEADAIRERLATLGIEVRDTPDGSEWLLQ